MKTHLRILMLLATAAAVFSSQVFAQMPAPATARIRGEIVACPQYPTTLPTLDELIGLDGVTEANAADALLEKTKEPADHVFTLHAELEGMKLSGVLDKLLEGWKAQGYSLVAMRDLVAGTQAATLPLHYIVDAPRKGRSGTLASQGPPFLTDEALSA